MRVELALVAFLAGIAYSAARAAANDQPFGREEQGTEMNRRRNIQALAVRNIANKAYGNGRVIEGTIANGVDFPVYDVRICLDSGNVCRYMATLHSGAEATFSFPTNLIGVPDWKVTWDVVPGEGRFR